MNDIFEGDYKYIIVSLGLGMLIGVQRESAETSFAGIRTFSLISLFGTINSILSQNIQFSVVSMLCLLGIIYFKNEKAKKNNDHNMIATDISIFMTFLIGVMVHRGSMIMATSLAVLIAFILQMKIELHELVARFNKQELKSLFQFLALSLVIFPMIPKYPLEGFEYISLKKIWLMVILISGIGLAGHILTKFMKEKNQIIISGFLGGVISSTASTWNYAKIIQKARHPWINENLIILISWATLYLRIYIEILVVAPKLNIHLPFLILEIQAILMIFWLWTRKISQKSLEKTHYNPTGLKTAFVFALFYTLSVYMFSEIGQSFSNSSKSLMVFISGFADVDAITLSLGHLYQKNILSDVLARHYLLLAILSNTVFKGFIMLIIIRKKEISIFLVPWLITLIIIILLLFMNSI